MKKLIVIITTIGFIYFAASIAALETGELYTVTVPVSSKSPDEQNRAISTALEQILVQANGGHSEILKNPPFKTALQNPQSYVEYYTYQQKIMPNATPQWVLYIQFLPSAIKKLLPPTPALTQIQNREYITIIGIESLEDHTKIISLLRHLPGVKKVHLSKVGPNKAEFELELISDRAALIQALTLTPFLKPISARIAPNHVDNTAELIYQWNYSQPTANTMVTNLPIQAAPNTKSVYPQQLDQQRSLQQS